MHYKSGQGFLWTNNYGHGNASFLNNVVNRLFEVFSNTTQINLYQKPKE